MPDERWGKIESIYHAALEQEKSRRAAYLAEACAGDTSLEQEIASLLAEAEDSEGFLAAPALEVAARSLAHSSQSGAPEPPASVGRYRLTRLLGEGGMGAVYEAQQDEPKRIVAVKMLRTGLATRDQLRRFRQESEALARLQHPGIAQIYESDTADTGFGPQPYFAMEFIRGLPLDDYAKNYRLGTRQRLMLMVKVCDAVSHAHQRGLIHRDLKPGNILVDETGQPKILDFGVARLAQPDAPDPGAPASFQTGSGQLLGTLAYMSPEQVLGDPLEVDIRSDVYSLGVILYQLLSGRLPYDVNRRQLPEAVQVIREQEPPDLRTIDPNYRGDIETIAKKALEKDKAHRYASAADLGGDIQRYLDDEPIAARPASTGYRLRKFTRRHRVAVSVAAGLVLLLAAFSVFEALQLRRITRERDRANRERDRATRITDFMTSMFKVSDPSEARGTSVTAREILDKASNDMGRGLAKDPEVRSQMMEVMAATYSNLGLNARAHELAQRALDARLTLLGHDDPKTLESMTQLGWILEREGHRTEAEKMDRQALAGERRILGPEDPLALQTMSNLAFTVGAQGHSVEGEKVAREAIEIGTPTLGPESAQVRQSMYCLVVALGNQGRYSEAERESRRLLDVERRVLGTDHPDTLRTMDGLAVTIENQGRLAEAEQAYRDLLAASRRVMGPEHPMTANVLDGLGVTLIDEGRLADSEKAFREAWAIQLRTLGPENPYTLLYKSNLADVLFREGHVQEVEKMQRETLATMVRVLGPQHPGTLTCQSTLAGVLNREGRYAEAEKLARGAFEIEMRSLGPQHDSTLDALQKLGIALAHTHRYPEARKLFRDVIEKGKNSAANGNSWSVWYRFACVAEAADRPDDALQYLEEAIHRGYKNADAMMADDDLKDLRRNPKFQALLAGLQDPPDRDQPPRSH